MSADRDAMYAAFEVAPGDLTGYLAMSDLLRDDRWEHLAHAFAWMGARRVWPHRRDQYCNRSGLPVRRVPARFRWAWYLEVDDSKSGSHVLGVLPRSPARNHMIPTMLIGGVEQRVFPSHQAAVMWLGSRLAKIYDVWALAPRPKGLPLVEIGDLEDKMMRDAPAIDGNDTEDTQ